MFGDMLTKALIGYLENNPEFKQQIDAAKDGLTHFINQSNTNAFNLQYLANALAGYADERMAIRDALARIEATLSRIELAVTNGVNLKDDALLVATGALTYQATPNGLNPDYEKPEKWRD